MPSFVANFQSPFDLKDFEWYLKKGFPTNLGSIFEPGPGEPLGMWTVPKWARVGDRVFLMCAATSTQHMAHVCKQAKQSGSKDLIESANREREMYARCASRILAVGRVAATPLPPNSGGSQALWWAPIRDFVVLNVPIEPEDWKLVFKVSRTGSITKLSDDQATDLEELVRAKNPYARIPRYLQEPSDYGEACSSLTGYAGFLALDPGRMIPAGTNDGGQTVFHYRKSVIAEDFDRDFFGSGLVDIEYDETLQRTHAWPKGAGPESVDVSELDAPTVLAVISYVVCGDHVDEGLLYVALASGLVDRCLFRLALIEDAAAAMRQMAGCLADRIVRAEQHLDFGDASILGLLGQESADVLHESLAHVRSLADAAESALPAWDAHAARDVAEDERWTDEDAKKVVDMWTMGLGVMGGSKPGGGVQGEAAMRALKGDWKTLPMPMERTEIELGLPITADEFDTLAAGHVPRAMEDHWFMYFDGEAFCFHRSWTGICVFKVHVAHSESGDGYVLSSVTANRDRSQYSQTSDDSDRTMVRILVGQALGKDVESLWEAYHGSSGQDGKTAHPTTPMVVGFWQPSGPYGFMSNWNEDGFDLFGTRYPTSEHWVMWQKARVMGDSPTAAAILAADSPRQAKVLGGKVSPYDDAAWRAVREELAYVGVREKFLQNPELARSLMDTGGSVLAEASPYDHVWGVGIDVDDPGFGEMTGWRGENLQGRICMRVREDLRLLMPDGPLRFDMGTTDDDLGAVVASSVGDMTLLSLARNPKTRPFALCYARICQHLSKGQLSDTHAFLMSCGPATIAHIDREVRSGNSQRYTSAGWRELLTQLAFYRRVGLL